MRRTGAWIAGAVMAVGCAAPAAPTSPAPVVNPPAALTPPTGRILEYGTLAPIEGASVSFFSYDASFSANPPPPVATVITGPTGGYWVNLPSDQYRVAVDGVIVGGVVPTKVTQHGDFIARFGNCAAGYGFVTDAATGAPLEGAVVSILGRPSTTSPRGWYLIDFGCNLPIGGGTTVIEFTREGYARKTTIYGRGVQGMHRIDMALMPE